jgi:hypothetical protein
LFSTPSPAFYIKLHLPLRMWRFIPAETLRQIVRAKSGTAKTSKTSKKSDYRRDTLLCPPTWGKGGYPAEAVFGTIPGLQILCDSNL